MPWLPELFSAPVLQQVLDQGPAHRLQPDTELTVPTAVASYVEELGAADDTRLETCALVDDGRACALEYNVVRPGTDLELPQAGVAVFVADGIGGLAAVRVYGDSGA